MNVACNGLPGGLTGRSRCHRCVSRAAKAAGTWVPAHAGTGIVRSAIRRASVSRSALDFAPSAAVPRCRRRRRFHQVHRSRRPSVVEIAPPHAGPLSWMLMPITRFAAPSSPSLPTITEAANNARPATMNSGSTSDSPFCVSHCGQSLLCSLPPRASRRFGSRDHPCSRLGGVFRAVRSTAAGSPAWSRAAATRPAR